MVWIPEKALARIRELEAKLADSVSREVYTASLARTSELERSIEAVRATLQAEHASTESRLLQRISDLEKQLTEDRKEHARQMRWYGSMLARRNGSLPLPPTPEEKAVEEAKQKSIPRQISDSDLAKYEAIVAEGRRVGAQYDEIEKAVEQQIGLTPKDLAEAIKASGVQ